MTNNQTPEVPQLLFRHEPSLTGKMPDGRIVFRPGLIYTVFFADGYSTDGRAAIAQCFDYFFEQYGAKIRGKRCSALQNKKFSSFRPEDYPSLIKSLLFAGENYATELFLSSEPQDNTAPEISIGVLTGEALLAERYAKHSYFKICLPLNILRNHEHTTDFLSAAKFFSDTLKAKHGYAGISPVLPYDFDNYLSFEFDLAKSYSGLEIDTHGFTGGRELKNEYIKGVNWITVVGDELAAKIGGREAIVQQLDLPGITITPYDNGLIIQAGDYPSLGAPDEGLPPLYVAVNRVLKPLRIPEPDSLHYHMPDRECFDTENTRRWYARFDLPEDEPERQRVRALPGETVPHTGWWFTPAIKGTAGFRHFKAGETLPETRHTDYGEVIWYWRENLR